MWRDGSRRYCAIALNFVQGRSAIAASRAVDSSTTRRSGATSGAVISRPASFASASRSSCSARCASISSTGSAPYDPANVKAMKRALRKAELPGFRLYDLRHTYATLLLDRAVPITYVSAQLGHAKPTTTLRWYAHARPKALARYVDLLDGTSTPAAAASATSGGAAEEGSETPMAPNDGTTEAVAAVGSDALAAVSERYEDGPARNRTANPLIKSPLEEESTTGHDEPRPRNPDEYER